MRPQVRPRHLSVKEESENKRDSGRMGSHYDITMVR